MERAAASPLPPREVGQCVKSMLLNWDNAVKSSSLAYGGGFVKMSSSNKLKEKSDSEKEEAGNKP